MKGYRLNPDMDHVTKICTGIAKRNGNCPCQINKSDATLCPCDEFIQDGNCTCKLYIKME